MSAWGGVGAAVQFARRCKNAKLYDVYRGAEKSKKKWICKMTCSICRGLGEVVTCPTCDGAGMRLGVKCETCNAAGCVPYTGKGQSA